MYEPPETRRRGGGRHPAAVLQARERDLLDVAEQLFVRHSFHEVSIATIATTVRVATKTIYVKFGGKRGLLQAIVARDLNDWQRQIDAIETSDADARARLEALAGLMLRRALSARRARLHADAVAEWSPELAQLAASVTARDRRLLERLVESLPAPAHGSRARGGVLCDAFVGCVLGRHIGAILGGTGSSPDREAVQRMAADSVAGFLEWILPAGHA
ncbi:TetR/AcrR family transcriptional regulator [Telluria mixta]|uniref:TetR/AcrR family transcriptional regulator n=1 Tax=Telluria mixta TaxID=34071 RepID=A0ABT2BZD1_9BURK|nr:helix-turn-helix domain-containing protein [Telluria mixta]MCS0630505.1 TetR/AcrR family transcriptional regulator [Telluria mixta]WEM94190.1 helix-turn-helix domain containing protein [Telluria mixta]